MFWDHPVTQLKHHPSAAVMQRNMPERKADLNSLSTLEP